MTLEAPEAAYHRAVLHWSTCPHCSEAGGADARPADLCIAGRWYLKLWEFSARRFAEAVPDAD